MGASSELVYRREDRKRDWLLLSRVWSAFVVLELIIGFTLQMCLFTGNFLNIFIYTI